MESIIDYFKRITGLVPTVEQEDMLNDLVDVTKKQMILNCGRGFSKSFCAALASLWYADQYAMSIGRPVDVLFVSHQRKIYDYLDDFFRTNKSLYDDLRVKGDSMAMPQDQFELMKTRSRVLLRLDTSRQVRGEHVDILIIDETQAIGREIVVKDALPTTSGSSIAKVVLIGTPSEESYFTQKLREKNSAWIIKSWPSNKCPWNAASLKLWEAEMTPLEWRTEIMAKIPRACDLTYFPPKFTKKNCYDCDTSREGGAKSTVECGIDWGYGSGRNYTILSITEVLGTKRKLICEQRVNGTPEMQCLKILPILKVFNPSITKVDSRPSEFQLELMKYWKFFPVDAVFHKKLMASQLQRRWRCGQLIISNTFVDLQLEVKRYRFGKSAGDNRVDALMLSCYEPQTPFTKKKHVVMV